MKLNDIKTIVEIILGIVEVLDLLKKNLEKDKTTKKNRCSSRKDKQR